MERNELQTFWNWNACRKFIEVAIEHYKHAPGWFTDWMDDLYIRLEEQAGAIPLDEICTLAALRENGTWEHEHYAVNRVYHMFDRLGRSTAGIMGY